MNRYYLLAVLCMAVLAGCSAPQDVGKFVNEYMTESSTNRYACGLALRNDKTFSHNCDGRNIKRGKWELDGQSIRFLHDTEDTTVCSQAFDGSILVLAGDSCLFSGRYQTYDDWRQRHG